jgi:hypothetical protein
MLKRALIPFAVFTLAVWAGVAATPTDSARIVDIRVGRHADYDRLVIELERRVDIRKVQEASDGRFVLVLDARPLLPHQTLETPFKRMGTVVIEGVPDGTRIQIEAKPRRVRAYHLNDPARIVVDLADPGPTPFKTPRRVEPLTEAPAALPVRPAPAEGTAKVVPPPPSKAPPKPKVVQAEVEPKTPAEAKLEKPAPPPALKPPPEAKPERAVVPELAPTPKPRPRPPILPQPKTAKTREAPQPRLPRLPRAEPELEARPWFDFLRVSAVTGLSILALLVFCVALLAWYRLRRSQRRHAAAQARATALAKPRDAATIMPEEIAGAGDRLDILDKRIDEEVRSRIHLEEHVKQLQEEIKVMNDRLHKLGRRGEGAG